MESCRHRPDPRRTTATRSRGTDPVPNPRRRRLLVAATPISERQLNRATLNRQLLLHRARLGVVEGVRRVVALQAQEPASAYLALWNRLADFDGADLDRAFAARTILKATLMRVTLHAIGAPDYPAFHEAMQPTLRGARLNDRRFTRSGLKAADADALLPEVLEFAAQPRTNAEAEAWLDERLGETPKPGVWWAFRQFGLFVHAPTGGSWSFGPRPSYVAAPDPSLPGDIEASLRRLAERYLEGFGPASVQDFAQFGMIPRPLARQPLRSLAAAGWLITVEGPNGEELFDVPGASLPAEDSPAPPRLLPMWDSTLLAYADRSRIIPSTYRVHVTRKNGDVLPTLLVDGYVAGVWRTVDDGIEAPAFHPLGKVAWEGLEAEAAALVAFLADREPIVFRRYGHWWSKGLPAAEVRVLGR